MDSRRRDWWWVLFAALAITCSASSSGGGVRAARDLGGPAVGNIDARVVEPAVLAGANGAHRVVASNRSVPDPFVRIVAILAALGIAMAALRSRPRIGVPSGDRLHLARRGNVSLRGPPLAAC
ncbi:MAG: hypothetical protein ABJC79_09455 [Acidimicrobiia bacterium]